MTADSMGRKKALCLVLGGVRSGKSSFALRLAARSGERVTFIATAEAGDDEMRHRVERHKQSRPVHWRTVEAPTAVGEALSAAATDADVVVIDCLGFLTANLMGRAEPEAADAEALLDAEMEVLLAAHQRGAATTIVVSNEVGMGVVPPYPTGRQFRDLLGRANQRMAMAADRVYWMLAGLPIEVKASGIAEGLESGDGIT
jgi:adenosylcobinamide kinase/adenosylcobinamide-phosphate guanylyltransferase